jgi:hypothetical protein
MSLDPRAASYLSSSRTTRQAAPEPKDRRRARPSATRTRPQKFNPRKLIVCRVLKPLRQMRREGKAASVRQVHQDPAEPAIIAGGAGTRFVGTGKPFPFRRGVDLCVSQCDHGCPPEASSIMGGRAPIRLTESASDRI